MLAAKPAISTGFRRRSRCLLPLPSRPRLQFLDELSQPIQPLAQAAIFSRETETHVSGPARPERFASQDAYAFLTQQPLGERPTVEPLLPHRHPEEKRPRRPTGIQAHSAQPFKSVMPPPDQVRVQALGRLAPFPQCRQGNLLTQGWHEWRPQRQAPQARPDQVTVSRQPAHSKRRQPVALADAAD